jgi:hypothetical protein
MIQVWKAKATEIKSCLLSLWAHAVTLKVSSTNRAPESTDGQSQEIKSQADDTACATTVDDKSDAQTPSTEAVCVVEMKSERCTPAQYAAKEELDSIKRTIGHSTPTEKDWTVNNRYENEIR